jgi:hypothetical protein
MFYRPADDLRFAVPAAWRRFVRKWSRPACIFASHDSVEAGGPTESAPVTRAGALEEAVT